MLRRSRRELERISTANLLRRSQTFIGDAGGAAAPSDEKPAGPSGFLGDTRPVKPGPSRAENTPEGYTSTPGVVKVRNERSPR
jgi:hypothetical protein